MRYKLFESIKEESHKIARAALLKSMDLSRLKETALDNNKNKFEYVIIWL
jgi:hypothetical protein